MEIMVDILSEAMSGANKTRIMYNAKLNFNRTNVYLSEMMSGGLLAKGENGSGRAVYKTTEAGRALLETLHKAQEIMAF
jgi:predicted transcriptional regulator